VQPFGGEGLSGTGPKAGGPLYLHRLLASPIGAATGAAAGQHAGHARQPATAYEGPVLLRALRDWAAKQPMLRDLTPAMDTLARAASTRGAQTLAGPTGERNVYSLRPRAAVLCVAGTRNDLLLQLAAVLAAGSAAIWMEDDVATRLRDDLPSALKQCITFGTVADAAFDAALVAADDDGVRRLSERLALRDGPIVGLQAVRPGAGVNDDGGGAAIGTANYAIDRLQVERSVSINTAAAGGNASLMTIG
jgi:RHH-type proline utilization regulon transcriptional repressor/proline dehydrogenase/delta 1-pyrroline-5-carboxylate dehydrogenase